MAATACMATCKPEARTSVVADAHVQALPRPRLVFREAPVGSGPTANRWVGTADVEIRGFADAEQGDAGVELVAAAGSEVRAEPAVRLDFPQANRVTLEVHAAGASPAHPVEIELGFHDEVHRNRFWRVVRLETDAWQRIEVELPFLRYDRGLLPAWEQVTALGFTFRTDARLRVRSIELWQDRPDASPYLGAGELRGLFAAPEAVRTQERGAFVVMTDAPKLDLDAVLAALVEMHARVSTYFPGLRTPERPVPLLVFADDASYRAFWTAFAGRMGSRARPLAEDEGYTWLGIATAGYGEAYGAVRPVYVHEASHALLERSLGLDAQRSWLFEGVGNHEQIHVSQQDLASVYRGGLAYANAKTPLWELVAGDGIPTSRYWQATLLFEWFLADPGRRVALMHALEDMQTRGSADLRPLLEPHFGLDMPRFSAAFWAWAWARYARGPGT